MTIESILSRV